MGVGGEGEEGGGGRRQRGRQDERNWWRSEDLRLEKRGCSRNGGREREGDLNTR